MLFSFFYLDIGQRGDKLTVLLYGLARYFDEKIECVRRNKECSRSFPVEGRYFI